MLVGIGNRDRKYIGKLKRVVLIRVILPPFDKYNLFHPADFHSIFSIIVYYIAIVLEVAPKGRPR